MARERLFSVTSLTGFLRSLDPNTQTEDNDNDNDQDLRPSSSYSSASSSSSSFSSSSSPPLNPIYSLSSLHSPSYSPLYIFHQIRGIPRFPFPPPDADALSFIPSALSTNNPNGNSDTNSLFNGISSFHLIGNSIPPPSPPDFPPSLPSLLPLLFSLSSSLYLRGEYLFSLKKLKEAHEILSSPIEWKWVERIFQQIQNTFLSSRTTEEKSKNTSEFPLLSLDISLLLSAAKERRLALLMDKKRKDEEFNLEREKEEKRRLEFLLRDKGDNEQNTEGNDHKTNHNDEKESGGGRPNFGRLDTKVYDFGARKDDDDEEESNPNNLSIAEEQWTDPNSDHHDDDDDDEPVPSLSPSCEFHYYLYYFSSLSRCYLALGNADLALKLQWKCVQIMKEEGGKIVNLHANKESESQNQRDQKYNKNQNDRENDNNDEEDEENNPNSSSSDPTNPSSPPSKKSSNAKTPTGDSPAVDDDDDDDPTSSPFSPSSNYSTVNDVLFPSTDPFPDPYNMTRILPIEPFKILHGLHSAVWNDMGMILYKVAMTYKKYRNERSSGSNGRYYGDNEWMNHSTSISSSTIPYCPHWALHCFYVSYQLASLTSSNHTHSDPPTPHPNDHNTPSPSTALAISLNNIATSLSSSGYYALSHHFYREALDKISLSAHSPQTPNTPNTTAASVSASGGPSFAASIRPGTAASDGSNRSGNGRRNSNSQNLYSTTQNNPIYPPSHFPPPPLSLSSTLSLPPTLLSHLPLLTLHIYSLIAENLHHLSSTHYTPIRIPPLSLMLSQQNLMREAKLIKDEAKRVAREGKVNKKKGLPPPVPRGMGDLMVEFLLGEEKERKKKRAAMEGGNVKSTASGKGRVVKEESKEYKTVDRNPLYFGTSPCLFVSEGGEEDERAILSGENIFGMRKGDMPIRHFGIVKSDIRKNIEMLGKMVGGVGGEGEGEGNKGKKGKKKGAK